MEYVQLHKTSKFDERRIPGPCYLKFSNALEHLNHRPLMYMLGTFKIFRKLRQVGKELLKRQTDAVRLDSEKSIRNNQPGSSRINSGSILLSSLN